MIQHPTSPVRSATGLQIWADADWQARNNTAPAKAGQMRPMIASARCSGKFGEQPAISRWSKHFEFGSEQKWRHLGKSAVAAKGKFAPPDARGQDAGRANARRSPAPWLPAAYCGCVACGRYRR